MSEGIYCKECKDVGIVRVLGKDEPVDTLMTCSCIKNNEHHISHFWELPAWVNDCKQFFTREPCPATWFRPEDETKLLEKADAWKEKIKEAKKYWINAFTKNKELGV